MGVMQKVGDSAVPKDHRGFVAPHSREKALAKAYIEAVAKDPASFVDLISPDDEMYIVIRNTEGQKEASSYLYFKMGREALQSIENIIRASGRSLKSIRSFLDFASGYGRVTRFLIQEMDAGKIWISDIYKGAVDFQKEYFNVNGFYSETEPSKLKIPRKFEVVYVGSLFSHLPETRFKEWLAKLYEVLEDDGILIFSTNGVSMLGDPSTDTSGFTFLSASESRSLSTNEYGSAYVARDWVENASETLGIRNIYFLEKELCGLQDIYVITKKETASLEKLSPADFPLGHIDSVQIREDHYFYVSGWAINKASGAPVAGIGIFAGNNLLGKAELEVPRPDIGRHFRRKDCLNSGWVFMGKISADDISALDEKPITVSIRNHGGETSFLYAFLARYPDVCETDNVFQQGTKSREVSSSNRPKLYWELLGDIARYQEVMMTQGKDLIGYLASFFPISKTWTLSHLNGLVIGCAYGEDSPPIPFAKTGAFEKLLIIDSDEDALVKQEKLTAEFGLNDILDYKRLDCEVDSIPGNNSYDFIFTMGTLRRVGRLEGLFSEINESLRDDGVFAMREYIGPPDFQYTDKQVLICDRILEGLPDYLKMQMDGGIKKRVLRPKRPQETADPAENAGSHDIIGTVRRNLKVLACNMTGGTILAPLLQGIAGNFEKGESERAILKTIIVLERTLIEEGVMPSDYVFLVAGKKRR